MFPLVILLAALVLNPRRNWLRPVLLVPWFGLFLLNSSLFALGYWAPPRAALPLANLLYLVLAYAGGLWTRPSSLPGAVAGISRYLPTRAYADALVAAALGLGVAWRAWLALGLFTALFGVLAVAGYRRDEGRRFS